MNVWTRRLGASTSWYTPSKTSRRGASKTRVMRTSRSEGRSTFRVFLFLAAISLLLGFQDLEVIVESFEALFPELAVALHPLGDLAERHRLQPARTRLRLAPARDQPGALQYLEVLGDRRQAHVEGRGQLVHGGLARGQAREDRASGRIGERGEGGVESFVRHGHDEPSG